MVFMALLAVYIVTNMVAVDELPVATCVVIANVGNHMVTLRNPSCAKTVWTIFIRWTYRWEYTTCIYSPPLRLQIYGVEHFA